MKNRLKTGLKAVKLKVRPKVRSKIKFVIGFVISCSIALVFFSSCRSGSTKSTSTSVSNPTPLATWSGSMNDLKNSLTRLLPWVIDVNQYNDPRNQSLIQEEVKRLAQLSKQVNHSPTMTYRDPSVRFISNAFTEDLQKVEESLSLGKREYARYNLMNVTAYCIECHTRTSTGPSFSSPEFENALKKVGRLERGEYLIAIRQFDRALDEFKALIKEKLAEKNDFLSVDKAVRYALAVTVKFKKDPKESLNIVEMIDKNPNSPYYLKQNAASWRNGIHEWLKEKPTSKKITIKEKLETISDLVKRGDRGGLGMFDKGGDIYFLRALSELHLLLAVDLNKDQLGETLYLTGLCYEAVKDLSLWTLHENYYESCIRSFPNSAWSKKCYHRLEESIYFGFTGSSGTRVPLDVQVKLQELQKLAL